MATMNKQTLTVPITFDMPVTFQLSAGQVSSSYSLGTFSPMGINGQPVQYFTVPAGLQFSILNYKLLSPLTTDLYLSYIYDSTVQSSVADANYFVVSLQNPSRLPAPIVVGPTHVISLIAYPTSTVTTAATETVLYSVMLSPVSTA